MFKQPLQIILLFLVVWVGSARLKAQNYDRADKQALSAPSSATQNTGVLANWLCQSKFSETEKARAIFVWLAENVNYDTKSFFSGQRAETSPEGVLKVRTTVCQGYCALFKDLAEKAKLKTVIIGGYAKGYGYVPGKLQSNHAWIGIKLEGKWHLIDPTWGAGHLNEDGNYIKSRDDRNFKASPSFLIMEHLPLDPAWQLLPCTLTVNQFLKDTAEVRQIAENMKPCKTLTDSLDALANMSPEEQNLVSAKRAFAFYPKNTENLGFAYLNHSVYMREQKLKTIPKSDTKAILDTEITALNEMKEAKKYLLKSTDPQAARALVVVEGNIKNSENYIKFLKEK